MKKSIITLAATLTTVTMSMTAYAAEWKQDTTGWRYEQDGGGYAAGWQWIDGNEDGVAECYNFDGNGYMLANTTTPDGYTVDANGAWTVNGIIQTQGAANDAGTNMGAETGYDAYGISNAAIDMLELTKEENAAKYGAVSEYEMSGEVYVKYQNGLEVIYWKGNTYEVVTNTPSNILEGIDNSIQKGQAAEDNLKANGYTDTYNDGPNAVTKVNIYQITWTPGIPLMRIVIMNKYK